VVQNALFLGRRRLSVLTIPWCTYTDPEIAQVGLSVRQAPERGTPVKTFTIPMHDVDRAITDGEEAGFVKIHVRERTEATGTGERTPRRRRREQRAIGRVWTWLLATSFRVA
jgi:pyruvate/2-oxoglutarate dehydrogenase complex dihydrolipoamide dehydrogenase (E3) component